MRKPACPSREVSWRLSLDLQTLRLRLLVSPHLLAWTIPTILLAPFTTPVPLAPLRNRMFPQGTWDRSTPSTAKENSHNGSILLLTTILRDKYLGSALRVGSKPLLPPPLYVPQRHCRMTSVHTHPITTLQICRPRIQSQASGTSRGAKPGIISHLSLVLCQILLLSVKHKRPLLSPNIN